MTEITEDAAERRLAAPRAVGTALDLIGRTPMIEVTAAFDTGPCRLWVKLESANPGGSIKDRIALTMIEAAEREGRLKPGGVIVEATAGNTGLGLAQVGILKGYRLVLVVPDKMAREKIQHLRGLGVDVRITRSDVGKGHPDYYQDMAERIARELGGFYVNQFSNPANPFAHETTTGPEIAAQLGNRLDAMVCGVGSGGTLTGLSRYFARALPECEMVLADPQGSILSDYVKTGTLGKAGSWVVEGIGEDFLPANADLSRVKKAYSIPDTESLDTARLLLKKAGILAGSSSGTLIAAALRYCREQTSPKRVCTFVCDSGNKYLSKMFNDFWMADQGFLTREGHGDLRDVITRRYADKAVVTLGPKDTLLVAYARMKLYDVSQLPVLEGGKVVGMIDESDLLLAAIDDETRLRLPVSEVMSKRLRTVEVSTPVHELLAMLDQGYVPIVVRGEEFIGLITRIDLLNHLRRKLR